MLCARPVALDEGQLVGCGQCMNCLINRRRQWTARILLEGIACEAQGRQVSWCTLTYRDEALPVCARGDLGDVVPTLRPRDYQLAFKRLRKRDALGPFRFALVGEYGDRFGRPHYHAMLFGPAVFHVEHHFKRVWEAEYGHIQVRPWALSEDGSEKDLRETRARYIAHYVTKKMSSVDSKKLHPVQEPEFWRVSRRPGLGCSNVLLDASTTKGGAMKLLEDGDVASTVRIGKKVWPLHPKVRAWLREELGVPQRGRDRRALTPPPSRARMPRTSEDYHRAAQAAEKEVRRHAKAQRDPGKA